MNNNNTPLIDAIKNYNQKKNICFHVPGHRQGQALPREMHDLINDIYKLDLTELPGLDDLHNPHGAIAKAQEMAAQTYGAQRSYFLINGSSCGLQALILATCRPDDLLILPRNVHRSVLTGLILSGARPIYIYPKMVDNFAVPLGISAQQLGHCLEQHPTARSVLMVHPNYYGVVGNITEQVKIVHGYNGQIIVDEAHGGHFKFHRDLPKYALSTGADAVVQSTHKVGGALTQASMLHLNSTGIDRIRLEDCLRMVQSTSPSYILMASLDAARHHMSTHGEGMLEQSLRVAYKIRQKISTIKGIELLDKHHLGDGDIITLDKTRLVINVNKLGITGYQGAEILADKHGVQVEMADLYNIVALLGLNATYSDGERLYNGLVYLQTYKNTVTGEIPQGLNPPPGVVVKTPREAWLSTVKTIPLEQGVGCVSADSIGVYPPGIPVLCPGELISKEMLDYLLEVRQRKLHVHSSGDVTLSAIRVLDL